jgi:hypothetical protein
MSTITPQQLAALRYATNKERDRRMLIAKVSYNGIVFDADLTSRSNLADTLTAYKNGVPIVWPIPWRDASNITRESTYEDLVYLSALIFQKHNQIYNASWNIKDVILPALTKEQAPLFDVTNDLIWA